ncbi:MAG TPA: arsenate reductase ArsC [Anaerolineales bacterium]|nr:arsenate reductase ArsC [Anaerolineales bacterium]
MPDKPRVLFLCTGNSARSQMAEAFLRKYGGEIFEPYSAGLEPKGVNPLTIRVMDEAGIDISAHTSKSLDTYLGKTSFQYLVTVCDDADQNCPTGLPGINERMHWSFEDPARFKGTEEEKLARFREIRDLIEKKVKGWVADQF